MTGENESMSNSWYHCGRCGSLFEESVGHSDDRVCGVCSQKPTIGIWPVADDKEEAKKQSHSAFENRGEALYEGGQRTVRKKSRKNPMMRVVVAWSLLMGAAVYVHHHYSELDKEKENRNQSDANMAKGTMADERVALLSRALPQCHKALAGFLTAGTPENRNQFVADPIATAGKMAVFYQSNPLPRVDVKRIRRIGQEPVKAGDEWVVETRWKEGDDGAEFDAVFRRGSGTWMLDWDHFSRYSEYPWALFLAGSGSDEAEFRLLARMVSSGDEAERRGSRLRFVLLSPEFGKPSETGVSSPEFVVDRRSDEGLLLEAAFNARQDGELLFGRSMKAMEPEGLIRVRVRVKRGELGGVRSFDIEKIIACHWMTSEVLGFNLDELKDDLFGGL